MNALAKAIQAEQARSEVVSWAGLGEVGEWIYRWLVVGGGGVGTAEPLPGCLFHGKINSEKYLRLRR